MDVHSGPAKPGRLNSELFSMGPDVTPSRPRGFTHDPAELARQAQAVPARQRRSLDVEDLTTSLRPGQSGRYARGQLLSSLFEKEAFRTEHLGQLFGPDDNRLDVSVREPPG